MIITGLNAFGMHDFKSYSPPIRNIKHVQIENAMYDEIHIREKTSGITSANVREDWQLDTVLLAKFLGDLEAGNINNNGLEISKFAIKRRRITETKPITLGYKTFVNNNELVFKDYSQGIGEYIYSIVPVGVNGLEGLPNEITTTSDFAGWFLLDRTDNSILPFDKFIGTETSVDTMFNQSMVQIDTLSRYPKFFYTDQEYHSFSLQTVIIPDEWERSGKTYQDILNKYVRNHKPFLAKSGSGEIYIVNVSAPTKSAPQNVYGGYDYFTLTLQCVEVMSESGYNNLFL